MIHLALNQHLTKKSENSHFSLIQHFNLEYIDFMISKCLPVIPHLDSLNQSLKWETLKNALL